MKKAYFFWLVSNIFVLLVTSCGKEAPQNVLSSTGQTGGTMPTATIYSDWYTPSSYINDTLSSLHQFYTNIPASGITQDILNKDTVIVYCKMDGYNPVLSPTNLVSQLPISVTYQENTTLYTDRWSAVVSPGKIQINFVDNHDFYSGLYYAHKFRYRLMPR